MTTRNIQWAIASVFLILGGWCLVAPQSVINLVLLPQYQSSDKITLLFLSCFGAQACIAGIFAITSRFTRMTFLVFGVALLPFFIFDYWFTRVDPVFNNIGLIDLMGNVIMLALCFIGWRKAGLEE